MTSTICMLPSRSELEDAIETGAAYHLRRHLKRFYSTRSGASATTIATFRGKFLKTLREMPEDYTIYEILCVLDREEGDEDSDD